MSYSAPHIDDLQLLLTSFKKEKYGELELLTAVIHAYEPDPEHMPALERLQQASSDLIVRVGRYLRYHRLVLLPYIADLLAKEDDGHDCRSCGGGCSIEHAKRLAEIEAAHKTIWDAVGSVIEASTTMPHGFINTPDYLKFREDLLRLQERLSELLFIEQSALVPVIVELQRNIGVHG